MAQDKGFAQLTATVACGCAWFCTQAAGAPLTAMPAGPERTPANTARAALPPTTQRVPGNGGVRVVDPAASAASATQAASEAMPATGPVAKRPETSATQNAGRPPSNTVGSSPAGKMPGS